VISLKGEQIEWFEGFTVRAVLEETGLYGRLVYVAVNGKRIKMRDWDGYRIPDGADVEVFPMVLGG
jgi:thiamine biosynthesis protein ThiS